MNMEVRPWRAYDSERIRMHRLPFFYSDKSAGLIGQTRIVVNVQRIMVEPEMPTLRQPGLHIYITQR